MVEQRSPKPPVACSSRVSPAKTACSTLRAVFLMILYPLRREKAIKTTPYYAHSGSTQSGQKIFDVFAFRFLLAKTQLRKIYYRFQECYSDDKYAVDQNVFPAFQCAARALGDAVGERYHRNRYKKYIQRRDDDNGQQKLQNTLSDVAYIEPVDAERA